MTRSRSIASFAVAAALVASQVIGVAPVSAQPRPAPTAPQPAPSSDPIKLAQQQYEDLKYEESIQTLAGALLRPNTKQQKIEIYKLLFLDLVTLNRLADADGAARGLLTIDPTYEFPATESPRFRTFFSAAKKKWEDEGRPGSEPVNFTPITIQHAGPAQAERSTEIRLSARIDDPQHRVTGVTLFYRSGSKADFQELAASMDGNTARVNIPPSAVKAPYVEYYIAAYAKGEVVSSRGDATAPMRVIVPEPSRGWVLPVVIGGVVIVAGGVVAGLFAAGVFNKSAPPAGAGNGRVTINIGE